MENPDAWGNSVNTLFTDDDHSSWIRGITKHPNPESKYFCTGCGDSVLRVCEKNIDSIRVVGKIGCDSIRAVDFSSDGKYVITGSTNCEMNIFEFNPENDSKFTNVFKKKLHTETIWAIKFGSPIRDADGIITGHIFASGSQDKTIIVGSFYPGKSDKKIHTTKLQAHTSSVNAISFFGNMLATGSQDSNIFIWINNNGDGTKISYRKDIQPLVHRGVVTGIDWNQDGKLLASSCGDHAIRIWNVVTKTCLVTVNAGLDSIWCIKFSPNYQYVACGGADSSIGIWKVTKQNEDTTVTMNLVRTFREHRLSVNGIEWYSNNEIISVSSDKTVRAFKTTDDYTLVKVEECRTDIRTIKFSKCYRCLIIENSDRTTTILKFADHTNCSKCKKNAQIQNKFGSIPNSTISQDGEYFAIFNKNIISDRSSGPGVKRPDIIISRIEIFRIKEVNSEFVIADENEDEIKPPEVSSAIDILPMMSEFATLTTQLKFELSNLRRERLEYNHEILKLQTQISELKKTNEKLNETNVKLQTQVSDLDTRLSSSIAKIESNKAKHVSEISILQSRISECDQILAEIGHQKMTNENMKKPEFKMLIHRLIKDWNSMKDYGFEMCNTFVGCLGITVNRLKLIGDQRLTLIIGQEYKFRITPLVKINGEEYEYFAQTKWNVMSEVGLNRITFDHDYNQFTIVWNNTGHFEFVIECCDFLNHREQIRISGMAVPMFGCAEYSTIQIPKLMVGTTGQINVRVCVSQDDIPSISGKDKIEFSSSNNDIKLNGITFNDQTLNYELNVLPQKNGIHYVTIKVNDEYLCQKKQVDVVGDLEPEIRSSRFKFSG